MASPTQWIWVWASSGSWWWTRKPGVLQGSQRVGHNWATELNWGSVESIKWLTTSSPFSLEFWKIISLIILQQDSFNLKEPLFQAEVKQPQQGSQWLFHGRRILNYYFFFILFYNFQSFYNETAWMLYVEKDAVYPSDWSFKKIQFKPLDISIVFFFDGKAERPAACIHEHN